MRRRDLGALAALLVGGILAAGLASHVRERLGAARDPSARLSREGLVAAVSSRRLSAGLDELRHVPVYRRLLASPTPATIRRRLGWKGEVPSLPWPSLIGVGTAALGLYERGWVVVAPAGELRADGPIRLDMGGWRLLASSEPLLGLPPPASRPPLSPGGGGGIRVELHLAALASRLGRGPRPPLGLLPDRIEGHVAVSGGSVRETWAFGCERGCLLDALAPEGSEGAPSSEWNALPEDAAAVAWVHLLPGRLESLPSGGEGGDSAIGGRLERIETFLDLPLRRELARSLAGTAVVALLGEPGEGAPRLLAAFDLLHPERVSRLLDRLAALGLLTESVKVRNYRGVSITSWSSGSRRGPWEPAVAVDGGALLVATRRSDLEDALDRRRDAGRGGAGSALRGRLEALARGSWKAWSRSPWALQVWEEIVTGLPAAPLPVGASPCEASLRFDGRAWVLEGGGAGPAVGADFVFPSLRRALRALEPSPDPAE